MSEDAKVTLGIVDAGTLSWTDPATGERHTTKLDLESLAVALSQFSGSADMTNPVEVERFATALRSSQQGRDLLRHQHEEGAQQKLLAEFGKFLAQRDATSESDTDVPPERAAEAGGEQEPRVPSRSKDYKRWQVTWSKIKGQWDQGRKYEEISKWLAKMHPGLACSPDIVADIIRAGEAGRLKEP